MAGDGVPDVLNVIDFRPLSGGLDIEVHFDQYGKLTRAQHNDLRAAGVNAGGMNDVSAAYAAIKSAWNSIQSGRGAWLDRVTTGADGTETDLIRRGVVWHFVARGDIPSPPQP